MRCGCVCYKATNFLILLIINNSAKLKRIILKVRTIWAPCSLRSLAWNVWRSRAVASTSATSQVLIYWMNWLLCYSAYEEPCQSLITPILKCVQWSDVWTRKIFALTKSICQLVELCREGKMNEGNVRNWCLCLIEEE